MNVSALRNFLALPTLLLLCCGPGLEEFAPDVALPDAGVDAPVDLTPDMAQPVLSEVKGFGSNPGKLRMYTYAPAGVPKRAPGVVAMHDCGQTAAEFVNAGWNHLARAWKFHVVYPERADGDRCFQWWSPAHAQRGKGEALSIKQMVDHMKAGVDPKRVFVAGFSAGGAMAVVMMASYPDVFAGGAVTAGIPYRCADSDKSVQACKDADKKLTAKQWGDLVRGAYTGKPAAYPRVSLWHGVADLVVSEKNLSALLSQWSDVHGADAKADETKKVGGATHSQYKGAGGKVVLETWSVANMGHGTAVDPAGVCGKKGSKMLDVAICSTYHAGHFFGLDTEVKPDPPPKPKPDWKPKQYYSTNYHHVKANRAYECGFYSLVCAKGSKEYLGLNNVYETNYLCETASTYFVKGKCPAK